MSVPAGTSPYMVPRRNADGSINAGDEKIVNLAVGSATGDAVEYDQMNTAIAAVAPARHSGGPSRGPKACSATSINASATNGIITTV